MPMWSVRKCMLTASIQCWKANFCALASKNKPFPTCKKQLTSESNITLVSNGTKGKRKNSFQQNVQVPYSIRITQKKKSIEKNRETLEALSLTLFHRDAALSGKLKNEIVLWFNLAKSITCHLQIFKPHFLKMNSYPIKF